jgi:hypothetical protein
MKDKNCAVLGDGSQPGDHAHVAKSTPLDRKCLPRSRVILKWACLSYRRMRYQALRGLCVVGPFPISAPFIGLEDLR